MIFDENLITDCVDLVGKIFSKKVKPVSKKTSNFLIALGFLTLTASAGVGTLEFVMDIFYLSPWSKLLMAIAISFLILSTEHQEESKAEAKSEQKVEVTQPTEPLPVETEKVPEEPRQFSHNDLEVSPMLRALDRAILSLEGAIFSNCLLPKSVIKPELPVPLQNQSPVTPSKPDVQDNCFKEKENDMKDYAKNAENPVYAHKSTSVSAFTNSAFVQISMLLEFTEESALAISSITEDYGNLDISFEPIMRNFVLTAQNRVERPASCVTLFVSDFFVESGNSQEKSQENISKTIQEFAERLAALTPFLVEQPDRVLLSVWFPGTKLQKIDLVELSRKSSATSELTPPMSLAACQSQLMNMPHSAFCELVLAVLKERMSDSPTHAALLLMLKAALDMPKKEEVTQL